MTTFRARMLGRGVGPPLTDQPRTADTEAGAAAGASAGGVAASPRGLAAPLAADPGLTRGEIPGMSVAGVMLVEYLALSRLTSVVTGWPVRRVVLGIGVALVAAAPVLLIDPDTIYDDLITPSLFALWLSQLVTFAVYPRFVARRGGRVLPAAVLAAGASALAVYGLWTTIATTSI
jgi:hypothetical protein